MRIQKLELGLLEANCYIVIDEKYNNAVVIDPGEPSQELIDFISDNNLNVKYILLTHGHFDHMLGASNLRKITGAQIAIHELDEECLYNVKMSLHNRHLTKTVQELIRADKLLNDGNIITFGEIKITVKHTPGHTKGGVCYICDDCIFTGDTLFRDSIGKTSFFGGSMEEMMKSINSIDNMEGNYVIYPGHGESTTLDEERKTNIYIREARNAFNN